jgi:hypothetical protein
MSAWAELTLGRSSENGRKRVSKESVKTWRKSVFDKLIADKHSIPLPGTSPRAHQPSSPSAPSSCPWPPVLCCSSVAPPWLLISCPPWAAGNPISAAPRKRVQAIRAYKLPIVIKSWLRRIYNGLKYKERRRPHINFPIVTHPE